MATTGMKVSDAELVDAVRDMRAALGYCTYPELAEGLGMSVSSVHERAKRLIADGSLVYGPMPGSLRPA